MKLLDKILVPVSIDHNERAHLETAVRLAEKFNSRIILLAVLPQEATIDSIQEYITRYTEKELAKITRKLSLAEDKIVQLIRYGNTFDQIISTSETENVNLILHVNHHREQAKGLTVDVLSEKLLRKSQKPVWIVKPDAPALPERILCSVDYSDASVRALNNAIKIARTFQSRLDLINIFEPLQESFSPRLQIDFEEENIKREAENKKAFKNFLNQFDFTDVDVYTHILKGNPDSSIISFAKAHACDLIFMGATGKTYLKRLMLGSVTENVMRAFPASMIVTKAENLLDLKIESDITSLEKHFNQAVRLEEVGYYREAIEQFKTCLDINDLHVPAMNRMSKIYEKMGEPELAAQTKDKALEVLRRLWDRKIEIEIRKGLKL